MSVGPYAGDVPDMYEAPSGIEVARGLPDDVGSRDPSSTTVSGAVANAMAQQAELASDVTGQGSTAGDIMNLPY